MRIEDYFDAIRATVDLCAWAQSSSPTFDQRSSHEGFLRGEVYFLDGSVLHLREYVDCEVTIERLVYAYQYLDAERRLAFRYDNTGHHRKLNLPTYPHHQHDGSEEQVIASDAPTLAAVLDEIGRLVRL